MIPSSDSAVKQPVSFIGSARSLTSPAAHSRADDALTYKIFCVTWAIATLFHMAQSRVYTAEFHYLLLTLAAIAVLLKPQSTLRLIALIILQLYDVVARAPYVSNHWTLTAFVNLTIVSAWAYLIISRKTFRLDIGEFLRFFAPVVRIQILILYFFVVLHKLNSGFFSVDFSCAAVLYKAQHLESVLPISDTTLLTNIYTTIFIETLIPVLLLFAATRNIGLLIGVIFHCIIGFNSFNGFYDFSAMIFASYVLFTGPNFARAVRSFYHRVTTLLGQLQSSLTQFSWPRLAVLLALFGVGFGLVAVLASWSKDYFRLLWGGYSLLFILLFAWSLRGKPWQRPALSFRLPQLAFLLFPALLFINGASPYLGLKTESSFAMFSNLRTEGGITNHFFIPASTQLFDFQKDVVEIVRSSDPQLQAMADKGQLLPYFQFKNHVASNRPAHVEYRRGGQQQSFHLATASPDDALLRKSPFLMRKIMGFRAIAKNEPQPCQH